MVNGEGACERWLGGWFGWVVVARVIGATGDGCVGWLSDGVSG